MENERLAHEIAHVKARHLSRMHEESSKVNIELGNNIFFLKKKLNLNFSTTN